MNLNNKMSWLSAAGLGVLLAAGSPAPAQTQRNSIQYGRGDRRIEGERFNTMRALAHRLDEAAQRTVRVAGDTPQERNGRMKQRFLWAINDFSRQASSFHERMDQYQIQPWDVADEVSYLDQRAGSVNTQIRGARAFPETYRDWAEVTNSLDLMSRVLRGQTVSVPAASDREYRPFDSAQSYSNGQHHPDSGLSASDAPYDPHYAPRSSLIALQDDLVVLDDDLSLVSNRNPRYAEFHRRADGVRRDVIVLVDQMRQHSRGHDGVTGGSAEVDALRQRVAVLRDDIENSEEASRGNQNDSFTLPVGTDIVVMLDQDLSSRSSRQEDPVEASLVSAIRVDGRTLIPAGAKVSGVVREVRSRSLEQKDGWLRLDFDSLTPENGVRTDLRSHVVSVSAADSSHHTLRNGGIGAVLGGVLGGLIDGKKGAVIGAVVGAGGGVLASQGEDVELPSGSIVTIRLDAPLSLWRR